MVQLLLVEDDKNLRRLLTLVLEESGYAVLSAQNGLEALEILKSNHADLVITDIMMPGVDGYALTESLRQASYDCPILMVSAKETIEDKRRGFLVGTDDYMVKPLDMDELLLRVAALLRRSKIANEHRLVIGELVLDHQALTYSYKGLVEVLPKKEFLILYKLLSYPKKIFTRAQLMDEIWGYDTETDERTVDVHIKRLRERMDGIECIKIITVRGLGYKAETFI